MYIKGITDYGKDGKTRETGLFAGPCTQDGELRQTNSGKSVGSVSVRAFNRKDGSAAFLTIKTFSEEDARRIAALKKGDRIMAAGTVESRDYNGKTYTDLLADFIMTPAAFNAAENRAALEGRMDAAGFDNGKGGNDFQDLGDDDGELPF